MKRILDHVHDILIFTGVALFIATLFCFFGPMPGCFALSGALTTAGVLLSLIKARR